MVEVAELVAAPKFKKAISTHLRDARDRKEQVTKKMLRKSMEVLFKLPENSLDAHKEVIKCAINDFVNEEESEEEADVQSPPPKPKKKATKTVKPSAKAPAKASSKSSTKASSSSTKASSSSSTSKSVSSKRKKDAEESDDEEPPLKKPVLTVKTKSGAEVPKQIKKSQESAMSSDEFHKHAEILKLNVFGNQLTGEPRSFSTGSKGWYVGGKIEVEINGKVLWGSLSVNCTLIGSKEWD